MFPKNKTILVVVAHPDDELLGLGATMHKLIREYQCDAHVLILGEGITSRSDVRNKEAWKEELKVHQNNMHAAAQHIGYKTVKPYDFPDNRFDTVALLDIVKVVEREKTTINPDIIFTHHGGDLNIDHQLTFQAVMTATRPMETEKVNTIICFETPSGTEWQAVNDPRKFSPNLFVEVSEEDVNAKIQGMECYQYERREFPHPRSPEALKVIAQRWGIRVGKSYAEAFQIIRMIQ